MTKSTEGSLYIVARGVKGLDIGGHGIGHMAQRGQRNIGDGYITAQPGGHKRGIAAYYTGTENKNLGGLYTGHTSYEFAFAALGLFEKAGAFLHRHSACHLAHGYKQGQCATAVAYGFVSDTGGTGFDHGKS